MILETLEEDLQRKLHVEGLARADAGGYRETVLSKLASGGTGIASSRSHGYDALYQGTT